MSPVVPPVSLLRLALAAAEVQTPVVRAVGGMGLLAGVAVLLAIPLAVAVWMAARRRRPARPSSPKPLQDAWAVSARRMEEGS